MKKIILMISLFAFMFLSGCTYKEGVVNASQKSSLYFTGSLKNTMVSIDNGERFSVKVSKDNQYFLTSGKHIVQVYKDKILIIHREIFLGDGIAKEIEVQ